MPGYWIWKTTPYRRDIQCDGPDPSSRFISHIVNTPFLPIHSLIPSPDFPYPRSSVVLLRQTSCSFRWIIGRGLEPAYTPDRSFSPIAPTPRPPPPTSLSRRLARSPIRASHTVPKGPLWTRSSLLFSGSQPAVIEVHYVSPGTGVLVPRFYTMTIRNGSICTHCPRV